MSADDGFRASRSVGDPFPFHQTVVLQNQLLS